MVRPCIPVVASVKGFAFCKDSLRPFHSHYVVLEAAIEFLIFVLLFVQAI
jgi:hypothetical protein